MSECSNELSVFLKFTVNCFDLNSSRDSRAALVGIF